MSTHLEAKKEIYIYYSLRIWFVYHSLNSFHRQFPNNEFEKKEKLKTALENQLELITQ
jgi:hypothetical protein